MSASYLVDLGNTCLMDTSIGLGGPGSGIIYAASGAVIGDSVDLLQANTFCNVFFAGNAVFTSGLLRLQVQTCATDTSGSYTDPTSGLPVMPTSFSSGGLIWLNSGGTGGGLLGAFVSGQAILSGFAGAAGFQRPTPQNRFARINVLSGDFYAGTLVAGFISQLKTTGSGGGFTFAPGSGTINV